MAIYEVVIEGQQINSDMLTVLHYDVTGGDPPDWQALADTIGAHITDHLVPMCGSNVSWLGITVREDIDGSVGLFVPFTSGTINGTQVDPDIITQAAVLVVKQTSSLVRPTQGRVFQGGISVRRTDALGLWETATADEVEAFWTDMREIAFSVGENALMVVKASNPLAPNTQPYSYVTSFFARLTPVVQRRRKRGAGS